jgi:hypothetical protein
MRTTVDIEDALLQRAKRAAAKQKQTLGALVGEALAAYLGSRKSAGKDPAFELLVRGKPGGKFPTTAEVLEAEEEEEVSARGIPSLKRDAAP